MEHLPCSEINSALLPLQKRRFLTLQSTFCVLHRHAIAAKSLPKKLKNVLSIAVSAVNYIRGNALSHRLFKAFCNEVGAKHSVVLYHTEVIWLSQSRVLTRVFELRKEIEMLLRPGAPTTGMRSCHACPHI